MFLVVYKKELRSQEGFLDRLRKAGIFFVDNEKAKLFSMEGKGSVIAYAAHLAAMNQK